MSVMLYHPDGKQTVWKIKCKTVVVDESKVESYLKDGWFKSPLDFDKKEEKPKKKRKAVKDD